MCAAIEAVANTMASFVAMDAPASSSEAFEKAQFTRVSVSTISFRIPNQSKFFCAVKTHKP